MDKGLPGPVSSRAWERSLALAWGSLPLRYCLGLLPAMGRFFYGWLLRHVHCAAPSCRLRLPLGKDPALALGFLFTAGKSMDAAHIGLLGLSLPAPVPILHIQACLRCTGRIWAVLGEFWRVWDNRALFLPNLALVKIWGRTRSPDKRPLNF